MLYKNHYKCDVVRDNKPCNTEWTDNWDCMCDDRCPTCNTPTSPHQSDELCGGCTVTKEDCDVTLNREEDYDCINEEEHTYLFSIKVKAKNGAAAITKFQDENINPADMDIREVFNEI